MANQSHKSYGLAAFDALLEAGIRQVAFVPDAGLSELIGACQAEASMQTVSPATEEDGVGLAYGAWLGGDRACVLMQSSGVGNCANAFAMAQSCRFPLLLIVTMRGEWGETNPWQVPMGKRTPALLELMGFNVHRLNRAEDTHATIRAACQFAFESSEMAAVLISQSLIGAKTFKAGDTK